MAQTRGITKRKPARREVTGPEAAEIRKQSTPTKRRAVSGGRVAKNGSPARKPKAAAHELHPNRITEQEILAAASADQLVALINQLTGTAQDEVFSHYKARTAAKMAQDEARIAELEARLAEAEQAAESAPREASVAATPEKLYISPIRKKRSVDADVIQQDDVTKELETIGITLDMLQLLTGLRITNYEEDDSQFYFDVEHSSTSDKADKTVVEYRLVISKKFSSVAEINYIPSFLTGAHKETLLQTLPDYFCDKLTFPYNTLSQFYAKMTKALNKGPKK